MYSNDFRIGCIRLYREIKSLRKVANLIGSSPSSICRWLKIDLIENRERKIRKSISNCPIVIQSIKTFLEAKPLSTIREVHDAVKQFINATVSYELIRIIVKKLGFTRKCPRFYPSPKNLSEKTVEFLQRKESLKNHIIVPIDETGFTSNIRPTKGYSYSGKRLYIKYIPKSNEKIHYSVVVAADPRDGKLIKSQVKGHFTKESFLHFLNTLQFPKQTVLLMDNVRFHHCREIKEYIHSKDWVILYTPPYSPWFNPIERVFSLVKSKYRKNKNINESFNINPSIIKNILLSRCLE